MDPRWPPPLRRRRRHTVLVATPHTARVLVVLISLFSVAVGVLTMRYPSSFFFLPDALGTLFLLAGVFGLFSVRCCWKSRMLGVGAGTGLAGAAILRGVAIWWDLGHARAFDAIVSSAEQANDVSRLIAGGEWIMYGVVLVATWPGLVHDATVRQRRDDEQ